MLKYCATIFEQARKIGRRTSGNCNRSVEYFQEIYGEEGGEESIYKRNKIREMIINGGPSRSVSIGEIKWMDVIYKTKAVAIKNRLNPMAEKKIG